MGPEATVVAILTDAAARTTITAYQVGSSAGLAVVDGTTLSYGQDGITLSNGDVVSVGLNGLVDNTTTANYQVITVSNTVGGVSSDTAVSGAVNSSTGVLVTGTATLGTLTSTTGRPTLSGSETSQASSAAASAASSSSSGVAPSASARKAAFALLGAVGGMVAYGL